MNREIKAAIDNGDVDRVRAILTDDPAKASALITWGPAHCPCETEPLHYLSDAPFNRLWDHGKQAELARVLIEAGAPVDGLPTSGETPLHGAASLGEAGVAEVLIDCGANTEAVADYPGIPDGTPLDFAVHFGMVDVVDLLVRRGAKVLSTRMAAGAGQIERVQTEWASLHDPDKQFDVFRCAVVCDRVPVVEFLLAEGVDVNADLDGATALHWAAWEAKPRMVEFLLGRGADASKQDPEHNATALQWARHRGDQLGPRWGHPEVIEMLTNAG
ncbi:Ankyrin repeat protein [Stieleria maiorica]|uniref:Ankyrin repeat protein n=1 Tax=Stieleria maiorica TaxID=2795974 RepID=A0A5B9MKT1_9BACT|nr:ankyrin repeat domain-containing protein [Stieleria maiorica]QEG01922.1 Ankyrin repeat protein [Stieleria maiorica]